MQPPGSTLYAVGRPNNTPPGAKPARSGRYYLLHVALGDRSTVPYFGRSALKSSRAVVDGSIVNRTPDDVSVSRPVLPPRPDLIRTAPGGRSVDRFVGQSMYPPAHVFFAGLRGCRPVASDSETFGNDVSSLSLSRSKSAKSADRG